MKAIPLTQAKDKTKVRVIDISAGKVMQRRLMGMGIYPGRVIIKLSQFMLKGPVAVKTGRSIIALGYGAANQILVEVVDG